VTDPQDIQNGGLDAVLNTALDAVVVMTLNGMIAGWNDVAERTFGWAFAEADGKRMSEMIIPERYREAHERGLAHFAATGEGPVLNRRIEIDALHREGHEIPVELSITRTSQFGAPVFLGFLRDISERRNTAQRQDLLISELNHRVKNLLGVVAGIAHMTARASTSLEEFEPAFSGRLMALSKAHEILTDATWEPASLRKLSEDLLGLFAQGPMPRASVIGPDILLSPPNLLSVSMILHELLTNAVKYGALAGSAGSIRLLWTLEQNALEISWIEEGLSGVKPPRRAGFGSQMIAKSISHELRGRSTSEWRSTGLAFTFRFNLD